MPRRNLVFANNEIYHVYCRSIAKEEIFSGRSKLNRALALFDYYRFPQTLRFSKYKVLSKELKELYEKTFREKPPLVDIFSYSFMPDHYHLLVKQNASDGIKRFVSNFQNGFAKFLNLIEDRHGGLFQTPFKAKWISNDEILLHVSRYIHLNPVTSYLIKMQHLSEYEYSSYQYYHPEKRNFQYNNLVNTDFLLGMFGSRKSYVEFVENQEDYQKELHRLKKLTLE